MNFHDSRTVSPVMRPFLPGLSIVCLSVSLFAQSVAAPPVVPEDADAIMARVAANQDQSESERVHYVYIQHARITSRNGKTVRCEEISDSRVIPTDSDSRQQLLKLDGRVLIKHKYVTYDQLPKHPSRAGNDKEEEDIHISSDGGSIDRDLVESMRQSLTNSHSKDGIGAGLFPLTSKVQKDYRFHLAGRERINDRDVFHITFEPKDKDDFGWKGDAYVDTTEYQPVVVRTTMSRKVPFAVRTMLGTNLPGLGFTVVYAPQEGGVWFPVSFGTEFKLRVVFFFSRQIVLSAENREFEKTHVKSTILPVADSPSPQH
jgi:hypothetical protein